MCDLTTWVVCDLTFNSQLLLKVRCQIFLVSLWQGFEYVFVSLPTSKVGCSSRSTIGRFPFPLSLWPLPPSSNRKAGTMQRDRPWAHSKSAITWSVTSCFWSLQKNKYPSGLGCEAKGPWRVHCWGWGKQEHRDVLLGQTLQCFQRWQSVFLQGFINASWPV